MSAFARSLDPKATTEMDWMEAPPPSLPPPPPQHGSRGPQSLADAAPRREEQSANAMKEMIFCLAALQPVRVNEELVKARPRRNVRISKEPQSVAARRRRERIGERMRILQQLVPGGGKMDAASMLEEAVRYVKFLKAQLRAMEEVAAGGVRGGAGFGGGLNCFVNRIDVGGTGVLECCADAELGFYCFGV